jgi:putative mRNA 3-end processing factor
MLQISNTTVNYGGEVPFSIDPTSQKNYSEINFITHAHSDHIKITTGGCYNAFIGHRATIDLLKRNYDFNINFISYDYNKPIKLNGNTVTLLNSGHILGSSAILVENDNLRYMITGDINTEYTNISKPIKPIEGLDFLILESTYGLEKYKFPKRKDGYSQINNWLKQTVYNNKMPIIITHKLGKTQEIIKEINRDNSGYLALPSETIQSNEVYNLYGKKLKNMLPLEEVRDADCVILPPSKYTKEMVNYISFISGKKPDYIHVTGHNIRDCVNLSSHSDYSGLIGFVRESRPKMVYTYHGHSNELAKAIEKELEIKAKVVKEINTNIIK